MAEAGPGLLEDLHALHGLLISTLERPKEDRTGLQTIAPILQSLEIVFKTLLDKPPRSKASRDAVISGKIKISDDEYEVSRTFQEIALQVADDLDLDELKAASLVLEAENDERVMGRSRRECTIIRFHQQRKFLLSCVRLLLELSRPGELPPEDEDWLGSWTDECILGAGPSSKIQKLVPRSLAALEDLRTWLRKLLDHVASATVLGHADEAEFRETIEYTRTSLVEQHELLSVILCQALDRRVATRQDFTDFLTTLKRMDRYDYSTVHLFPVLGTFITIFGSTEGNGDLEMARDLHLIVCHQSDDEYKFLPYLQAAKRAWWLAEYSGWYMEDAAGSVLPDIDIDAEDRQRSKQFTEALKDGAFDMMLAIVADVKASEWQDPARAGMRQWLQRRAPSLPSDTVPFSDFFQARVASQMQSFVDAFISNLPDVLRKLRVEEDEQRQLNQGPEQDLDLERFLLIIAYAYEGWPEAVDLFWRDPESNLAGFLQWASRRASTPLVSAFCEMLQALSEDSESATSAHDFLHDEGHHASGKMRKITSLTWSQIFRELEYFTNKIREKPAVSPTHSFKTGKYNNEHAETEPESAMMLECYLRLVGKLASLSEVARIFLLNQKDFSLPDLLCQLISSHVPSRLRACAFRALGSLLCRKTLEESLLLWRYLDSCLSGYYFSSATNRMVSTTSQSGFYMDALFEEISPHCEEMNAFTQLLSALCYLPEGYQSLNDTLPFSEDLGTSTRMRPGIEPYIDYCLGYVFGLKSRDSQDPVQQRMLRLSCLDLAFTCLSTFNEDLIIFANETNIAVDSAIATTDLATYVTLHPFARVMIWMFDSNVMKALVDTIHQDPLEVGSASPDSPLIQSVLRGIEVISKVLDLQATYLDLVRPLVKPYAVNPAHSVYSPTPNGAYESVEDGIMTSLGLVVDLGNYCGLGHAKLTQASLKLLEKISTSPRIISAWQTGPEHQVRRNKAIVALEEEANAGAIAGAFISEMVVPLDSYLEAESSNYQTKLCILDFLYSCIRANPDRPTVAHLLLGFHCESETLSVRPNSAFDCGNSLFHVVLGYPIELHAKDASGQMRGWLVALKFKAMRILRVLWTSRLSSGIVLEQLRDNDVLFHLLLQNLVIQPSLGWDGLEPISADFLVTPSAEGYVNYLSLRIMALEYITQELCSVAEAHIPALKRRIFEALGGQIPVDGGEALAVPSIFEFHDFLPQETQFVTSPPDLTVYRDLDIRTCLEEDDDGNTIYNLDKVRQMLLLKRNEARTSNQVLSQQELAPIEVEEEQVQLYAAYLGRIEQVHSSNYKVLKAWTKLLMVMAESNDFQGTSRISFILQALQAILPSLEMYGSDNPDAAYELARLAKVLLFSLDFSSMTSSNKQSRAMGSLVSDKLAQLFQISLSAIAKWTGSTQLRGVYYSICHRYVTAILDYDQDVLSGRQQTANTIRMFGERLMNVICDDAYSGDATCQSASLILLGTLVNLGRRDNDNYITEALNRLNFIGVLVDSLRNVMEEWIAIGRSGDQDQQNYYNTKLALLSQLCQTREGAKSVLHSSLFHSIEQSGLFSADPELQIDTSDSKALEHHYDLLVRVTRIIAAALISRGSHSVLQGRRFLTEHRMLVMHVLKRSAGIGAGAGRMDAALHEEVQDLAEAFILIIMATGFLEYEDEALVPEQKGAPTLFH